jgi:sialidase-1
MKHFSLLALLFLCALPSVSPAETSLLHVDVFSAGEDGYHTYRIPAIETATNGTLLVFAEARKYNWSDPGMNGNDIDLVLKRSTDHGQSWSAMTLLDDPGERWSACNPTTLVDRATGYIWLFYGRTKPDRSSETARPGTDDSQAWARYSQDHGLTWSEPAEITRVARDYDQWSSCFFGPGGAIQDSRSRLIVPVSRIDNRVDQNGKRLDDFWRAYVIYSDDHGQTWQRGELVSDLPTSENQLVELADGTILMDARQSDEATRRLMISNDGGATWSAPRTGQVVPPIAAGIERYSLKSAGDDRNLILWTGPKGPGRKTLVLRASYDEGKSFTNERVISEERAAYSDITILSDRRVGVIWERNNYQRITFSRFELGFLDGR